MGDADRRFLRILLVVSGPLFVGGGFLAAFTVIGAVLVFVGLGMLVTGVLLFTRLPAVASMLTGLVVMVMLTVWMTVDLSQRS